MGTSSDKWVKSRLPSIQRIWLLLKLNRPLLAIDLAQARLANRPTDLDTRLALIDALLQTGQHRRALDEAKTAVGQAPENANGHYALARVHGRLGNLHTAAQGMREVMRLCPYSADFFAFQAQLLFLIADYSGAVKAAESGLWTNPQHSECLLWLMRAAEQQGQRATSDAARLHLLAAAPDSAAVHREVGKLLLRRGAADDATEHLTQALALAPAQAAMVVPLLRQARRWQSWPVALLRLGDYGRAPYLAGWAAIPSIFIRIICAPVALYYRAIAHRKTKQDPLFRPQPRSAFSAASAPPNQPAVSTGKWLAFFSFICLLGWVTSEMKLPPAGFVLVVFFLGRSLLRQRN